MKPRHIAFLMLSYALVFWCSPDAVGPLLMFLPYMTIGGLMAAEFFTPVMLACYLGIGGGILACIGNSPTVRLASVTLLILSATSFVAMDVQRHERDAVHGGRGVLDISVSLLE